MGRYITPVAGELPRDMQTYKSNAFANKHVPIAMNPHATVEKLLETEFSMPTVPRL
jgi:hypothetical protein